MRRFATQPRCLVLCVTWYGVAGLNIPVRFGNAGTDETGGGKPLFSYKLARRGVKHGERAIFNRPLKRGSKNGGYLYTQISCRNP